MDNSLIRKQKNAADIFEKKEQRKTKKNGFGGAAGWGARTAKLSAAPSICVRAGHFLRFSRSRGQLGVGGLALKKHDKKVCKDRYRGRMFSDPLR